jgi:hypothetical protein
LNFNPCTTIKFKENQNISNRGKKNLTLIPAIFLFISQMAATIDHAKAKAYLQREFSLSLSLLH